MSNLTASNGSAGMRPVVMTDKLKTLRSTPWTPATLKAAVLERCRQRFDKLFEVPFEPTLRSHLHDRFRAHEARDRAVRSLLRRPPRREQAIALLKRYGIDGDTFPPIIDPPSLRELMLSVYDVAKLGKKLEDPIEFSVRDLNDEGFERALDFREYVITTFAYCEYRDPATELRWTSPYQEGHLPEPRGYWLSDSELAMMHILFEPSSVRTTDAMLKKGVSDAIDAERRTIARTRASAPSPVDLEERRVTNAAAARYAKANGPEKRKLVLPFTGK